MSKLRVHELAKTLEVSTKELIEKLVKGVLFGSIEKTDEKTYKENDNE